MRVCTSRNQRTKEKRLYELRECKNGKEFKVEVKGKLPGGIATVDEILGKLNYIY